VTSFKLFRGLCSQCARSIVLGTLLLWLVAPATAAGQASEDQIEAHFRAGQQALEQREFARAADEFKKVLALDPTLLEAEVNLGLAYQALFEYDLAARHLAKALRERPNLLGPNVIVGMDYLKLGSPVKAIPFLQQALKLHPLNRDAREALASSYLGQDNFRGAAEQFRQLALLDSDKSNAWFKLGHEYLDLAARLAYRGAHLYRESAWGHRFLGDLLLQRDRSEDAVKEYEKALGSDPRQSGLHTSIGQAYLRAQKWDQAETEFHRELQLDSQNEPAWLGLANLALARSQAASALECVRKVWQISPEFLATQRDFPTIEIRQEAAKALRANVQSEPEGAAKHFLLAGFYAATNESAGADREWKALQNDFSAWQPASNTATTLDACKAHSYSRCIDALQTRKHLTDAERLLLGKTRFTLQQYELAADTLAQVQGATTQNAEASYWLARTYQAQGADAYAQLQESFPNSWRTHQLRAEDRALHRDPESAFKEFHLALQLRPDEPELHEALGELYLDNQDDENAQNELEKALALDPSRTHALYLLGRLYVKKQENDKAVAYLQRALRLQPDLAEASSLLGRVYMRLGQFANAVPSLEKAASSDHYGNVHYQLYLAYRKLGRTELAQKELARSQDLRRSSLEGDQALIMGTAQPAPDAQ
jgi:tetratricopeptide (TPR) repeat protein